MNIKLPILILLLLANIPSLSFAQSDYTIYHRQINAAERCMFLQNNYDSARYYYTKTFQDFDFCFVKDCIIAAQLAALYKDTSTCFYYLVKGFENGLKPEDIRKLDWNGWRVRVFDTFLTSYAITSRLDLEYIRGHNKYIHRVDSTMRRLINELYIFDQIAKACTDLGPTAGGGRYAYPENRLTPLYDSLIRTVGYPGERLIGIDDVGLATELHMPGKELKKIFKRIKAADTSLRQVSEGDIHIFFKDFTTYTARVPFIYNSCTYQLFKPYFLDQIKKGNIHPREVAAIFGHSGYFMQHPVCHNTDKVHYELSGFRGDATPADIAASNIKRDSIYICTHELDYAKQDFQHDHHIQVFFGAFMM